ncbi:MAG: hypothetical protein ABI263_07295, partial [Gelidibacter sp.]
MVCILLLNVNTSLWANFSAQNPQSERQFNEGFQDNYSGRKYNYDGKAEVRKTTSKHGDPSKYSEHKPYVKEDNNSGDFSFSFNALNWLFILILI